VTWQPTRAWRNSPKGWLWRDAKYPLMSSIWRIYRHVALHPYFSFNGFAWNCTMWFSLFCKKRNCFYFAVPNRFKTQHLSREVECTNQQQTFQLWTTTAMFLTHEHKIIKLVKSCSKTRWLCAWLSTQSTTSCVGQSSLGVLASSMVLYEEWPSWEHLTNWGLPTS